MRAKEVPHKAGLFYYFQAPILNAMPRIPLLFSLCLSITICLQAQVLQKTAQDAYMITRMVEKYHVQPRPLNDEMSAAIFNQLLSELDEQRFFFTQEDINKLAAYRYTLDDEILNKRTAFLQLLINLYKQRMLQADTMIDNISKTAFNFSLKEKFTVAEDTAWPANLTAMRTKLYKVLKLFVLGSALDYAVVRNKTPDKKFTDSIEPFLRKKAGIMIKRSIKRIMQSPMGVDYMIGTSYCQALATCYDPHTDYFPPDIKTNFESELGNKQLAFGFALNEDDQGNAQIAKLAPGSPAFKSGGLNEGDKIQSVQWENKEPINVANAQAQEVNQVLSEPGGTKATLTVKKADGTTKQVTLHKEKLNTSDDEDRVRGFVLKGAKTIGYISLPAFYEDWDDDRGLKGCANDVAKEVIKLKKENIEGLVLDLRYNGGGSMQEAIELAGIFIDIGPVGQIKSRTGKAETLKDMNRGTIFDGPLLLLVNGYSASASEMLAGTLQDYNRALIVGSPTYGKATAQDILPMDTTINIDTYNGKANADSYIKLTISRLYRVNGTTAQMSGVKPDIFLPEADGEGSEREANEKFALQPNTIDANKYYKPYPPLPIANLQAVAKKETDTSSYFKAAFEKVNQPKKEKLHDISLFLDDAWQVKKTHIAEAKDIHEPIQEKTSLFTVNNDAYQQRLILADPGLKELNEEWKLNLLTDPYVKIAFLLAGAMIK